MTEGIRIPASSLKTDTDYVHVDWYTSVNPSIEKSAPLVTMWVIYRLDIKMEVLMIIGASPLSVV